MAAKTTTRKTARKPLSDAKKAEIQAAREAKVNAMSTVEDFELEGRRAERAFESLCTKYSEGNAMLILAQAAALGLKVRGVEDVAGFGCWTERGRSVVKGQHQSIFIWGHKVERKGDDDAATVETPAANETETQRKGRAFYPIVGLFHVSQTTKAENAKVEAAK